MVMKMMAICSLTVSRPNYADPILGLCTCLCISLLLRKIDEDAEGKKKVAMEDASLELIANGYSQQGPIKVQ